LVVGVIVIVWVDVAVVAWVCVVGAVPFQTWQSYVWLVRTQEEEK
jgi:hypothetical protein